MSTDDSEPGARSARLHLSGTPVTKSRYAEDVRKFEAESQQHAVAVE